MNKKFWFLLLLLMSLFFVLAACSDSASDAEGEEDGAGETEGTDDSGGDGEGDSINENGTITYAIDQAPEGLFIDGFAGSAIDSQVNDFIHEDMVTTNENLEYIPHLAEWETEDNQEYTFTLEEGVKWHNGEELTMEDWQFAIEVLAHPDYEGPRYNYVQDIEGAEEYRAGEADSVSGFEIVDDYTAVITFNEPKVNNLENLWTTPMPKAELEDVPVADMMEAPEVRENPVGLGPFKVKEVVQGEYITLERFDDYWQGTPKLAEVTIRVIDPSLVQGALQNEEIDIMEVNPEDVEDLEQLDNVRVEEQEGLGYSYVGFRFGSYDYDNRTAVDDYDKYDSKELRKAMFYAIDREALVDTYLAGKATIVNTPVPSVHWIAADESELIQYDYDPEKAEELLEEAGYVDVNDDGYREDPNGDEFVVTFSHYAGSAAFEGRSQALMQAWEDVGLKTELATGQLIEFNTYNEMKENDDENIEVFFGAWSVGTDPDPSGLWHSEAEWNYGRWLNEESDELLDEGLSEASFDQDHRAEVYVEWQKLFNEELPALPLWENLDLYGINNKLEGVTIDAVGVRDHHEWYVTE
ncbi:peptide/nickel transport system substrate-binding protein [Lentibacillus halodurans]|uniref:Peptide/nickel transport system substrate-binding protein n=1 Tax=Lentibacillus halodurans TaxID=237679 RepID=A0A1I0X7D7_9BACI|nr:oligopeptide ABC transporter substrate-binding protein [Lentibacillus halodurans]SFA96962.1 peptide/nickel transport system substrate-binding protein [Lentibacillus halodurans]